MTEAEPTVSHRVKLCAYAIAAATREVRSHMISPPPPLQADKLQKRFASQRWIAPNQMIDVMYDAGYLVESVLSDDMRRFLAHNNVGPNQMLKVVDPQRTHLIQLKQQFYLFQPPSSRPHLDSRGLRVINVFSVKVIHTFR